MTELIENAKNISRELRIDYAIVKYTDTGLVTTMSYGNYKNHRKSFNNIKLIKKIAYKA